MNNNMRFDPMTGKPIQNVDTTNPTVTPVGVEQTNQQNIINNQAQSQTQVPININTVEQSQADMQNQLQNIPTVDQSKQEFINNVQSMTEEKKEDKKEGVSFIFIIILFVVILVSIYFLFPLLSKYI